MQLFNFQSVEHVAGNERKRSFIHKYSASGNGLCKLIAAECLCDV